jgi:hypothetical protein
LSISTLNQQWSIPHAFLLLLELSRAEAKEDLLGRVSRDDFRLDRAECEQGDVLEQGAQVRLIGKLRAEPLGQQLRGGCRPDDQAPVVEELLAVSLELVVDSAVEGDGERQLEDFLVPEDDCRPLQVDDLHGQPVEGGVDEGERCRRQGRVHADDPGHGLEVRIVLEGFADQLGQHGGEDCLHAAAQRKRQILHVY